MAVCTINYIERRKANRQVPVTQLCKYGVSWVFVQLPRD